MGNERTTNVETISKMREKLQRKIFSEDISNLKSRRNMKNMNVTMSNFFTNKVNVQFNVFGTLMLNKIIIKINNTNVVTVNQSSFLNWTMKFQQKILKPTRFRDYISNTPIFGPSTRARKSRMFGGPRYMIVTKIHTMT